MNENKATATDPSQNVRLPKPLSKKIKKAAKNAGRSKNSEIVKRLNDSFMQESA